MALEQRMVFIAEEMLAALRVVPSDGLRPALVQRTGIVALAPVDADAHAVSLCHAEPSFQNILTAIIQCLRGSVTKKIRPDMQRCPNGFP